MRARPNVFDNKKKVRDTQRDQTALPSGIARLALPRGYRRYLRKKPQADWVAEQYLTPMRPLEHSGWQMARIP